jgi:PAS domain S-box-containing protein
MPIVIDDQQNIIRWNPKAEEVFGWTLDEVLGKLWEI